MFPRLLRSQTLWLWAAHLVLWGSLAGLLPLLLSIYLLDIPYIIQQHGSLSLTSGLLLAAHGLIVAGSLAAALFLVWRRPKDLFVVYVSIVLLWMGLNFSSPDYWAIGTQKRATIDLLFAVGLLTAYPMLFLLPDGRLVFRWALPAILAYTLLRLLWPDFSVLSGLALLAASLLEDALWLLAVFALFWRYRTRSTPEQQQQIKWVLYGVALVVLPRLLYLLWRSFFYYSLAGRPAPPWENALLLGGELVTMVLYLALPAAFLLAALKYRLWDINYVINRSLAYGALTLLLGGLFLAGFLLLRALLSQVFGVEQDLWAASAPAAAAALLFNPARVRLKRWVERTFYGIQLDYEASLKAYRRQEKAVQRAAGPDSFGSYTLLNLLGRGGMGEIYQARHTASGRLAAVKLLPASVQNADFRQRFQREALTIQSLQHPNIIRLYESGEKDGAPYMVMEYLEGRDLGRRLAEEGRIPLAESLPILTAIAAALDYAHANGVIHRDIKPSNIMLSDEGRVVLMDFGIAHLANATRLTRTDGFVGTLDYVAPEQIQGAGKVDQRADIYSLGVLAFQMLSGRLPFIHSNPGALIMAHLMEPPPDLTQLQPDLPVAAAAAVRRALSKNPDDRFPAAGEFVAALGG